MVGERRRRRTAGLFACAVSLGIGGALGWGAWNRYFDVPVLELGKDVVNVDLLSVNGNTDFVRGISLTNQGQSLLRISRIETSCGCTSAFIDDNALLPGEATLLHIEVDGDAAAYRDSEQIVIISNDPMNPRRRVTVRFGSKDGWGVKPDRIDFGRITRSELPYIAKATILSGSSSDPEKLTDLLVSSAESPYITVNVIESSQSGTKLKVKILESAPSGEMSSFIRVTGPTDKIIHLDVYGYIKGNVYALPKSLILGPVMPGSDPATSIISVKARQGTEGNATLQSVAVLGSAREIVRVEPIGGNRIRVRVDPKLLKVAWSSRQVRGRLQIVVHGSNSTQEEKLNVPLIVVLKVPKPTRVTGKDL